MEQQEIQGKQRSPDGKKPGSFLGDVFSTPQFSSAIKELVHPGKDVIELLMRTVLSDVNEARDLALTLQKCKEFRMEKEMDLLLFLLAARTSVGGKARSELLMGLTGTYYPHTATRISRLFGKNTRNGEDGDR